MKTTDSHSTPLYLRALQEASRALTDLDPMGERHNAALIDDALQAHSAALPQLVEALNVIERICGKPEQMNQTALITSLMAARDEARAALAQYSAAQGSKPNA